MIVEQLLVSCGRLSTSERLSQPGRVPCVSGTHLGGLSASMAEEKEQTKQSGRCLSSRDKKKGAGRGRETNNDALSWRQAVLQGGESAADHSLPCAADIASRLGHDVALSKSSAESWKRRIWSIRINMLKSAGQHRAGYAASICRRPALRHGLIRELLIVVIPPSLLRANAESDPRAKSALNSRIQEIISWVLLGER